MSTGTLSIDLEAIGANWKALDARATSATAAVVKADGYGLGAAPVARHLWKIGVRQFFVAVAEEGAVLRRALGPEPDIFVFSGHMVGDTEIITGMNLIPLLNSTDQITRHLTALPEAPFGIQLDSGMNRLGLEPSDWTAHAGHVLTQGCRLVMSHLACADEPGHPMNAQQLSQFQQMTDGIAPPRSLAATGGILLGPEYHFDLCRPGVGLYGGAPFAEAQPVARLDLPVIQIRDLTIGETVGYGNSWTAERPSKIATVSGGYADGLHRALSSGASFWHGEQPVPLAGRVSMDLIGVDVTDLPTPVDRLTVLGPQQTVDDLAACAGTIGYEILTSLGARYARRYTGG